MRRRMYRLVMCLLNGPMIAKALYAFAHSRLSKPLIKPYARVYKINLEEALEDIETYENLHEFFTRKLKDGIRSVDMMEDSVISPVDGVLEDWGEITPDREIIVKNKVYSISEMLGGVDEAAKYSGGTYLILYLSPSHYHRIHSPLQAKVIRTYTLGKKSYPVNRMGLKYGDAPLAKNFRTVTELTHKQHAMAMVKVGAMFINSVKMLNHKQEWEKGEEVAYFSFGSTVVLLFEKDLFRINEKLEVPANIRIGEIIGRLQSS
ncbi:phosphatidylserine decarboxylase [Bacillus sp. FJAT-50079]|uniref:phosphatidylserine decarboxylase n=1 Tax=Bacillus sp. FJAT-50079 TaxID=2833577 RepID=UPI001BC9BE0B|nr:phosphatidylserine decarboxylase [Bacillus sp. FJAT-50079]MBS4209035.1 phosphatidylserine decarboxylase [Bacillus sp. FJAT-50079]